MKHLSTLIKKIEQNLRNNPRNVPLLDMELMILVIACMIMKTIKSLGVEMWYLMRRPCTNISYRERNKKMNIEYTMLDEITENEIQKVPENQNDQQQQIPQTLTSVVRRSTVLSRPPKRYSLSLYYALLIDSSEPGGYEETMQVKTRKKREQIMKEEMDSLVHQTWDLV